MVKKISEYQQEVAHLQKQLQEYEDRLKLLDQLLEIEKKPGKEKNSGSVDVLDAVIQILKEKGKALHISEIHSRLLSRGIALPGKGNEANVISRIQKSSGLVVRTGRGMYGLPEFGEREVRPTKKRIKPSRT